MRKKILKTEAIPNSKSFKIYYEGGGIGFGAESDANAHLGEYVAEKKKNKLSDMIEQQKSVLQSEEMQGSPASQEMRLMQEMQDYDGPLQEVDEPIDNQPMDKGEVDDYMERLKKNFIEEMGE